MSRRHRTAIIAILQRLTQIRREEVAPMLASALAFFFITAGLKRLGVHVTLALLPATAVLGFAGLAVAASLVTPTVFQAACSAVQRSLTRPARETLFTVVPREDKYKSKAFIDTFVYRSPRRRQMRSCPAP